MEPDALSSVAPRQLDTPTLCAHCQGGRLVGQAVHELDVRWRFYLTCTDCDTKIELGGSVRQFAQPSTVPPVATANREGSHDADVPARRPTRKEDRTCERPGCTTILSAYNTTAACWAHTGSSF